VWGLFRAYYKARDSQLYQPVWVKKVRRTGKVSGTKDNNGGIKGWQEETAKLARAGCDYVTHVTLRVVDTVAMPDGSLLLVFK
jgi:hypothetical protein